MLIRLLGPVRRKNSCGRGEETLAHCAANPDGRTPMKTGSLVLAFSLVLSACAGWGMRESLNVTIADFTPVDVGVLEQRYDIKIRLQNPNDKEIAFDGVVFDLEINEKSFATGVSDQKGVVPRFGETLIEVKR
jgi:LEA14-like dessication related protein